MGDIISNLVSHWPCNDNAANTTIDDVVGTNDATLVGAGDTSASSVAGPGGSLTAAISLDGTDDHIDPATIDYANNASHSWSMWVRPSSVAAELILTGQDGATFRYWSFTSTTNVRLVTSSATANWTVSAISADTWYHVCYTRSGNSGRLYLNASESSTGAVTVGGIATVQVIGRRTTTYLPGVVCDVRHYSRALAAGDVTDLYNLGVSAGGVVGPLVGGRLVGGHLTRGRLIRA